MAFRRRITFLPRAGQAVALAGCLLLGVSCGAEGDAGGLGVHSVRLLPIENPPVFSRDILEVERAARSIRASLESSLLKGLLEGDQERIHQALTTDFRGLLAPLESARALGDATFDGLVFATPAPTAGLSPDEFLSRLQTYLDPCGRLESAELELKRLFLEPGGNRAVARAELTVLGHGRDREVEFGSGRALLRLEGRAVFRRGPTGWRLAAFETSGGLRLTSDRLPFVERTRAAGLVVDVGDEMADLMQEFVDRHITLALGGLSVIDWNDDGFPDVIQTSRGQTARLFLNDGRGGFLPGELPIGSPADSPSFVLVIDLDGDGVAELVTSRILSYGPLGARLGVYTRQGDTWRALEDVLLPVPRGVRRVAIQTIVPLDAGGDADADGLLDLFIGVYGDMRSRGKDYNTVEAHDGGDNYLLMNRGGLQFEEVSERAGISGTQYTYVAEAFDFDGDGDTDLFEGNDFGPNVLWLNDGSGFFQADGDSVFAGVSAYTMGVTLADPDNTGAWHLYISNMSAAEGMRIAPLAQDLDQVMRQRLEVIASGNMLYAQDPASGRWSNVSASAGSSDAGWAWGCVFWDPDNDGDRDLIVTNGFTSHSRRDLDDWNSLYWRQVAADAGFLARGERTRDVNRDVAFEGSFSGYQRDRAFHNVDGVAGPAGAFVEAAWLMGLDADHDGRCVVPADLDGDGDQDLVLWTLKGLRFFENRSPPRSFARLRLLSASPVLGAVVSLTVGGVTSREVVRVVDGFQSQRPQELHFGLGDATAIDRVQVRWPSGEVQIWENLPVGKRLTLVRGEAAADVDVLPSWPAGIWEGRAPESLPPGLAAAATARAAFVRFGPVEPVWTSMPSEHPGVAWFCAAAGQRVEPQEGWAAVDEAVLSGSHLGGAPPHAALYDRDGNLRRTFAEQPAAWEVRALLAEMERRGPYPEVLVQAGRLALSDHRHREARNLFRRAVAADPASPFGHEGLARALSFLGLPEEAEAAYGAAVAADPDYAVGHHNLGVLMALRGRPAEAVLSLERALAIGGSPLPTLLALGEARAEAGDLGGALAAFERALAAHPQAAEAAMLAGKVLAGQDRRGEARARLVQALALDPDLSEARRALVALDRLDARDAAAETQTGDAQSDP